MTPANTTWTGRRAERSGKRFLSERRRRREKALLDTVCAGLGTEDTVLDLGSGNGFLSLTVAESLERGSVIAVDLSEDMLAQLRRQARERNLEDRISIHVAEAARTGLDDNSVDRVITTHLLHEVPDKEAAIAEIRRVLRPGGRVIIQDVRASLLGRAAMLLFHHDSRAALSHHALEALLRHNGFEQIETTLHSMMMLVTAVSRK